MSALRGTAREYKVVLVGEMGVGRSAFVLRYIRGEFVPDFDPELEDSYRKQIELGEGHTALLDALDCNIPVGSMRDSYIRSGEGFLLLYDVTSRASFDELQGWYDWVRRIKDSQWVPLILIGHKADLTDSIVVPEEEGRALADAWGVPFFLASAKTNLNVDDVFLTLFPLIRDRPADRKGYPPLPRKKKCLLM